MRTILLAAALASAASFTATPSANACGPYMMSPRVFILASSAGRSFAVEGADASTDATFTATAPLSYDATQVAERPALAQPFGLTLVRNDGSTRSIRTSRQVLVKDHWMGGGHGQQVAALEIPAFAAGAGFAIAVAGNHRDLGWTPLAVTSTTDGLVAQITDTMTSDSVYDATIHDYRTTLKQGAEVVGVYTGLPMGVLAADGQKHLVVNDDGIAHAYLIY